MFVGLRPLGVHSRRLGPIGGGDGGPPANSMQVGMNLGWVDSWPGAYPFANVCYSMGPWAQAVGSGSFTQAQGVLTATIGTDEFKAKISDNGTGLPTGTYTVLNPGGATIGVGDFGSQNLAAYTTATSFTFTYTSGALTLWCRGSVSNVSVIMPGHLTTWQAGDIWNSSFISFHQNLGAKVLRTMDWSHANDTVETDWADRVRPDKISLRHYIAADGGTVPWEFIINLANRLDKDVWVCVPPRATNAYIDSMAALFHNGTGAIGTVGNTGLESGRTLYVELGNEIWNTAAPYAGATNWISCLDHTKTVATVDAATNIITWTGHGLVDGDKVQCWTTRNSRNAGIFNVGDYWPASEGLDLWADVIDANTLTVRYPFSSGAGGTNIDFPTGVTDILITKTSSATVAENTNYGEQALNIFNRFVSAMGSSRLKRVIGSQAAGSSRTTARLAVTGVTAATDYVAIAPYFYGMWWGGAVDISSGQFLPKVWSNTSGTVRAAVYSAGSTPSISDILAGTGAGHISSQNISYTYNSSSYTNGVAITGLSNGTNYEVFFVHNDGTYYWKINATVQASASASTSYITDSYANQALRNHLQFMSNGASWVSSTQAAAGAIPVIDYEGGLHFHETPPSNLDTWRDAYQESTEFKGTILRNMYNLAAADVRTHCYFGDVFGNTFSIADSYADTADQRYVGISSLGGFVAKRTPVAISNITAPDINNDPASFPQTIYTFSNAALTYTIIGGNNASNFDISGATLRLIADNGINWAVMNSQTVTIHVTDGYTDDTFSVAFGLGAAAWHEGDAVFAWNSVTDSTSAAVNPDVGGTLTLTGGGATVSGGLWNGGGSSSYSNTSTGLATTIDTGLPILVVQVMNKGTAGAFATLLQIGQFPDLIANWWFTDSGESFLWRLQNDPADNSYNCGIINATTKAYWLYYRPSDNKIFYGNNQTLTNPSGSSGDTLGMTFPTVNRAVAFSSTPFNYGTVEVVNRSGLTLAQALEIVQDVQNIHGI